MNVDEYNNGVLNELKNLFKELNERVYWEIQAEELQDALDSEYYGEDYFWIQKRENGPDIIHGCPEGYKQFDCENGKSYYAPETCCLFCKHCTDIIYDYTNGPYMVCCDLCASDEWDYDTGMSGECEHFCSDKFKGNCGIVNDEPYWTKYSATEWDELDDDEV